jgi:hypothetical protein
VRAYSEGETKAGMNTGRVLRIFIYLPLLGTVELMERVSTEESRVLLGGLMSVFLRRNSVSCIRVRARLLGDAARSGMRS